MLKVFLVTTVKLSLVSQSECCHIWVFSFFFFSSLLIIVTSCVLSHFEFLSFVTIFVFEFYHNKSFWFLSQFYVLGLITIWVVKFNHNLSFELDNYLSFWALSHLSFWVSLQFEFLSFCEIFLFKKKLYYFEVLVCEKFVW